MPNLVSYFLFVILSILPTMLEAQSTPDWINDGSSDRFPQEKFITGWGWSDDQSNAQQTARNRAFSDLSSKVASKIKREITSIANENSEDFSQHFSSVTQSSTALNLIGAKSENFYNRKDEKFYLFAYVEKQMLLINYATRRLELQTQIDSLTQLAKAHNEAGRRNDAIRTYLKVRLLFDEVAHAEAVLMAVDDALQLNQWKAEMRTKEQVQSEIERLINRPIKNIGDISSAIMYQLNSQLENLEEGVLVYPFTYEATELSGQFSAYLKNNLDSAIPQHRDMNLKFRSKSPQFSKDQADASNARFVLSGTFWEINDDSIELNVKLKDTHNSGETKAGATVSVPKSIIQQAKLELKPQNTERIVELQNYLDQDRIVSDNLKIEVFTNKGNRGVIFYGGDEPEFFVRVDRAAYVRLLYILADGTNTLLFDNFQVGESMANRTVKIPQKFECVEPFGAEMLVAIARTEQFSPLSTYKQGGFTFIRALENNSKGALKAIIPKPDRQNFQQSETRMAITTMPPFRR